jgi:hypothetical protein
MQNIINFQYFLSSHPTLVALFIVWSIVWKGFALWKAGKNKSFIWFIILLIVNTAGILEIIYLFGIKNKDIKSDASTNSATASTVKTETKVETVIEENTSTSSVIKEEITTPVAEVKSEEANSEEVKQEINQ